MLEWVDGGYIAKPQINIKIKDSVVKIQSLIFYLIQYDLFQIPLSFEIFFGELTI